MKFAVWLAGLKIIEVPIIFKDREIGVSKMHGGIIKEAFVDPSDEVGEFTK